MSDFHTPLKRQKRIIIVIIFTFLFIFCSGSNKIVKKVDSSKKNSCDCLSAKKIESNNLQKRQEINDIKAISKSQDESYSIQEDLNQIAYNIEQMFDDLEQFIEQIPRDTFDPQSVIDKIGTDPQAIFKWLKDNTYLVPYRGYLRGPIGVLMDRRGNSLDRAILLHELLSLAGNEVRLAHGNLSDERANSLFQEIHPMTRSEVNTSKNFQPQSINPLIEKYSNKYKIDRAELQNTIRQLIQEKKQMTEGLTKRVAEQSLHISEAVKKYREKQTIENKDINYKSLQDHWWVQLKKEDEWLDLDPTLPNSLPGQTIANIENTYEPGEFDDQIFHSIQIRVVAEQWKKGALHQHTVLEYSLRPSELFGKSIVLRHLPLNWPPDRKLFNAENPIQFLKTTIINLNQWHTILEIDGEETSESYLTAAGSISEDPIKESKKGTKGGGLGGFFGALAGNSGEKEDLSENKSYLTAEWVEYKIYSPGSASYTIRREIFDLIGPSRRKKNDINKLEISKKQKISRNLMILGQIEILPQVCQLSQNFIEELSAREMLSYRETFLNLIKEHNTLQPKDIIDQLAQINPFPVLLYNLILNRFNLCRFNNEIYLDSPNIFTYHTFLQEDKNGELVECQRLDIVANEIAVCPEASENPFQIRLEQGILDTNTEAQNMMIEKGVENTAILFTKSKQQNINWLLIQDAEESAWKKIQIPSDVRVRIEQQLAQGFWVLVPIKAISLDGKEIIGWWRLNPQTGNILGIGQNGLGQALTQYAEKTNIVLQLKSAIQIHAQILRCLAAAITSPLRGVRPQHDPLVIKCIWETVCSNTHKAAKAFMNIEVNWTNIIISQIISWAMKSLCKNLL